MSKVFCPSCQQLLEHTRGYLPTHTADIQRGELVTGSKICDLSNHKVITELDSIHYEHDCLECGMKTEITLTETFPGQLETKPGFLEAECIGCSVEHDGMYCADCGREVKEHQDEWHITDPGEKEVKVVYSQAEADIHVAAWHAANPAPAIAGAVAPVNMTMTPAQAIAALQGAQVAGPVNEPMVEQREAGWWDLKGDVYCDGRDPSHGDEHDPMFKAERHKKVLLVDEENVIQEEPDMSREEEEAVLNG